MGEEKYKFPEWVSTDIVDFYAEQKIKSLFDWQINVLNAANECESQNLIFSAPTSAGKSIVAELLAWKVASTGKKVLFVLPYISVAREKLHQLQRCWRRVDIPICGFIGPNASSPNEWLGAVCTIEKSASLINRAMSEHWFHEIGLIVVDEMHMVFDSSRGAHIEHMLSKIRFYNASAEEKVRIIGMSATIPDLYRIGKWLDAKVCEAEFRPIQLKNHIIIGTEMKQYEKDDEIIREFTEDPLITLAEESFRQNSQTLIMISSKLEAEKIALSIAMKFREINKSDNSMIARIKERADGLFFVRNSLERNGCKDRNLMAALAWGVSFHHAGLTIEERECIESGFREKIIIILLATSTLSAGVNLPAERVIIRAQTRGPSALTSLSYRQMVGRAGRTGYAVKGESYLIVKKCDKEAVQTILKSPIDQCVKIRKCDSNRTNLGRFILEAICTDLATTNAKIHELCAQLLFQIDNPGLCDTAVEMLLRNSFISLEYDQLSPTQLGRAAVASSLPPDAALAIFEDLNLASRAIALDTELHMLFLVTPINVTVWQECDWHHLFNIFAKLQPDHRRIAKLVGVSEKFILDQLQGRQNEKLLQVHIRFFSALALFDLINEMNIYEVSYKYRIPRGCLQTLQSQSATYAGMIVAFCLRLGWTYLKALLDGFVMRLLFGVRSELSELVAIDGIDGQRARVLHERGITCLSHLAICEASRLAHLLTLAVPYSRSNSNDGLGEWLFGEPRMKVDVAAKILKERARLELLRRAQELGVTVVLPKNEDEQPEEDEREKKETVQESCDSGYPGSTDDMEVSDENDIKSIDEMSKSVKEMVLTETIFTMSDDSEFEEDNVFCFKEELEGSCESDTVEETAIECLETSILKMKAPKNEVFLKRLQQTFSPVSRRHSLVNCSIQEDSFDKPVPYSIPFNIDDTRREKLDPLKTSSSSSDDSFDRPVPGSVPIGFNRRSSFIFTNKNESRRNSVNSIASENKSFDVFATPPTKLAKEMKARQAEKHGRVREFVDSSLSTFTSSPVLKHSKLELHKLKVQNVCHDEIVFESWLKAIGSSSICSIKFLEDWTGIAVSSDTITTFIPLSEDFEDGRSPNSDLFDSFSKCVIPLKMRVIGLKKLADADQVNVLSMQDAYQLFEKLEVKISRVNVINVYVHLYNIIECQSEDNDKIIELLIRRFPDVASDVGITYTNFSALQKTTVDAYLMTRISEKLQRLSVIHSSTKSYELEMQACQSVLNMFYTGILFDQPACVQFIAKIRKRIEELEEQIWKLSHGKFNIDSSNEVSNILFHRLGLVYPETSSCSSRKLHLPTKKLILQRITAQHPIIEKILEYRHIQHTRTQCLLPLEKYHGRIHCWFDMCTSTGRILTSVPNLQTVPKRSSDGLSARHLFKASVGHSLIGADYKQLELRVLAHLSNDNNLISIISADRDLFEELSVKWNFSRDAVKQLCYGIIYGIGSRSLAELAMLKVEEAEKLIGSFFVMFPGVRSYINLIKCKVEKRELIETIMGRKMLINRGMVGEELARMERVAVNYTVQGSASEIFKRAVVEIEKKIKAYNSTIVLTIHDEVLVECPTNRISKVSDEVRDCMQNSLSDLLRVPMKISLKTGQTWADLK